MLLAVLFVTHAAAEWVEISQQHYRKPIRTHTSYNPFTTPDTFEVEETTTAWTHNNRSVTEYNWNKPPLRQPNTGNVKRMQFSSSSARPTALVRVEDEYSEVDKYEYELRTQPPTKPSIELSDNTKQKATITRVPSVGNVKRVKLTNTPVKSPVLNVDDKEKVAKTRYEELPLENEQAEEILEHKRRIENKSNNRRIYIHEIRNQHSTEPTSTFPIEDTSFTEEVIRHRPKQELKNRSTTNKLVSPKPTFITATEDIIPNDEDSDKYYKVTQSVIPRVTEKKYIFTTESTYFDEDVITEKPKQSTKQTYKTTDNVQHRPVNKLPQTGLDENIDGDKSNERRKPTRPDKHATIDQVSTNVRPDKEINSNKKSIPDKSKKDTPKAEKETKPDSKVNNMENLVKLMKVVADTISQNSRRSFGGKMNYLHDLKDTILANIAERIDATWPDDVGAGAHRRSRSAHASPRGHHVHFPSSESALMTISFLTFAVFLIKLVLQVIHTYKNKAMMVAPVMVASAGRAALTHRSKH